MEPFDDVGDPDGPPSAEVSKNVQEFFVDAFSNPDRTHPLALGAAFRAEPTHTDVIVIGGCCDLWKLDPSTTPPDAAFLSKVQGILGIVAKVKKGNPSDVDMERPPRRLCPILTIAIRPLERADGAY